MIQNKYYYADFNFENVFFLLKIQKYPTFNCFELRKFLESKLNNCFQHEFIIYKYK